MKNIQVTESKSVESSNLNQNFQALMNFVSIDPEFALLKETLKLYAAVHITEDNS